MLDPGLISGVEAARIGLVSDLVEVRDEVGPAARRLAGELAAKGPGALAATKGWLGELDGTAPREPTESGARGSALLRGLEASLGLAGGEEERSLLERYWSGRDR